MKGLIAYNIERDKWELMYVYLQTNSFWGIDEKTFNHCLTDIGREVYTNTCVIEVSKIESTGDDSYTWTFNPNDLPKVMRLEDRIKDNIKVLSNYNFKYINRENKLYE